MQRIDEYSHPSVWHGPDMMVRTDWVLQLDERDISELDGALADAKASPRDLRSVTKADFVIPKLGAKLQAALRELEDGRGFVLVRGLPIARYSSEEVALIYWGIGMHFGTPCAQNARGDMLGHVRDVGVDYRVVMSARGYQTRTALRFHTDSTDLVGLLCVNKAKSGGLSRIVSSTAIHNVFAAHHPELCEVMYQPFFVDRRGEQPEGQKPYYVTPCFNYFKGRLLIRYNHTYIASAQRFPDVPRLSSKQLAALELMDSLCNDPRYYLDMSFEPGDMQFICNYVILHSRTEYEDHPEPERKRHLLRLWLRSAGFAELPEAFAERNQDMIAWQEAASSVSRDHSAQSSGLAH